MKILKKGRPLRRFTAACKNCQTEFEFSEAEATFEWAATYPTMPGSGGSTVVSAPCPSCAQTVSNRTYLADSVHDVDFRD